jgi:phenylpropionate dioxygenase-like ring-hydroxylating dioxygenase large terminal subunit
MFIGEGGEPMNYVRNAWYVGAWSADLEPNKLSAIRILGEPIMLWRTQQIVVALADRCVHRLAPLSLGRCWIWVWMGDPQRADGALIPPAVGLDDPQWILGHGQLDYQAEARYINDNLLDFSHLTYVHANSFGAGPSSAEDRPQLTALDRGIRFERWITATRGPIGRGTDELTDGWSTYDFLIPGVLLMWSGSFKLGTAAACNYQRPDYAQALAGVTFTSQAVTPTADRAARSTDESCGSSLR